MNDLELENQIKKLEREYLDLRNAINSLSGNLNNTAILRGTLSGAGASAESILKCIIRKEKINIKSNDPKIPPERADELRKKDVQGLMLDDLIKLVESKIPLNILTHLRTIQAWRNIGSHDKGEHTINETVNSGTLQVVSLALSEIVIWFVGTYLNHDTSNFIFQEEGRIEEIIGYKTDGGNGASISSEVGKINITISFEGTWFIFDSKVEIIADDILVGSGSIKNGFQIEFTSPKAKPNLIVKHTFRTQKIEIPMLELGANYEIIISYDRHLKGNFNSKPKKIIKN
jgi:hypothetical protein